MHVTYQSFSYVLMQLVHVAPYCTGGYLVRMDTLQLYIRCRCAIGDLSTLTSDLPACSALTAEYRGLCRRERELEREFSTLTEGLRDKAMARCV